MCIYSKGFVTLFKIDKIVSKQARPPTTEQIPSPPIVDYLTCFYYDSSHINTLSSQPAGLIFPDLQNEPPIYHPSYMSIRW